MKSLSILLSIDMSDRCNSRHMILLSASGGDLVTFYRLQLFVYFCCLEIHEYAPGFFSYRMVISEERRIYSTAIGLKIANSETPLQNAKNCIKDSYLKKYTYHECLHFRCFYEIFFLECISRDLDSSLIYRVISLALRIITDHTL